jgi:ABC-type multidrug transport system ATPase subunit
VVLEDVTKRYGRRRRALRLGASGAGPALDRVSLSFGAASFTAVLDVSGSGKSTLPGSSSAWAAWSRGPS